MDLTPLAEPAVSHDLFLVVNSEVALKVQTYLIEKILKGVGAPRSHPRVHARGRALVLYGHETPPPSASFFFQISSQSGLGSGAILRLLPDANRTASATYLRVKYSSRRFRHSLDDRVTRRGRRLRAVDVQRRPRSSIAA